MLEESGLVIKNGVRNGMKNGGRNGKKKNEKYGGTKNYMKMGVGSVSGMGF